FAIIVSQDMRPYLMLNKGFHPAFCNGSTPSYIQHSFRHHKSHHTVINFYTSFHFWPLLSQVSYLFSCCMRKIRCGNPSFFFLWEMFYRGQNTFRHLEQCLLDFSKKEHTVI